MSEFATFRSARRIADFTAQVTIDEVHNDDLTITDHPVENNSPITDHAFKNPANLSLTVGWSNSGERARNAAPDYIRAVYQKLLDLQATREPFTVVTSKRIYRNMLIQSISTTTDKTTENSLIVSLTLREIIIVQTNVVTIPPRDVQANPQETAETLNTGTKQVVPAPAARTSALRAIVGG